MMSLKYFKQGTSELCIVNYFHCQLKQSKATQFYSLAGSTYFNIVYLKDIKTSVFG